MMRLESQLVSMTMLLVLLLSGLSCQSQVVPERLQTSYAPLNEKLASLVPIRSYTIGPAEVQNLDHPVFLDARETAEYAVSHLPGALLLGYDSPDYSVLENLEKDQPLVVYCTVGYRSDKMVEKLQARGFTQVYNLYGSLYAWSLFGLPLVDPSGEVTERVHTYNRKWGRYYPHDDQKVY